MINAKLVTISRCADCPVVLCEHRVPCGAIPPECELEPAAITPTLVSYKCAECHAVYEQIPLKRPYCPICGTTHIIPQ